MRDRATGAAVMEQVAGLDGWSVFRAVPADSAEAEVDHLVVGPGGVFVVNTQHHRGAQLTVDARSVLVNGVKQPYLHTSDVEASRVRGLLLRAGVEAPVAPVIAVVGAKELRMRQKPGRAAVVRSGALLHWLTRRPARLDPATVTRAASLFDDLTGWEPVDAPNDMLELFGVIERELRGTRWARLGWGLAGALGIVAVSLPFLPR